jgi:hypothetical protein
MFLPRFLHDDSLRLYSRSTCLNSRLSMFWYLVFFLLKAFPIYHKIILILTSLNFSFVCSGVEIILQHFVQWVNLFLRFPFVNISFHILQTLEMHDPSQLFKQHMAISLSYTQNFTPFLRIKKSKMARKKKGIVEVGRKGQQSIQSAEPGQIHKKIQHLFP